MIETTSGASGAEAAPIAEAIGVSKRYGATVALSDARLRVLAGEFACAGGAQRRRQVELLSGS